MKRIEIPIIERKTNEDNEQNTSSFYHYKEGYVDNMYFRFMKGLDFTKEDLIYLYRVYYQFYKLTDQEKTYLKLMEEYYNKNYISKKIDIYKDIAKIFNCSPDEITDSQVELKKNPDKYVVLCDSLDLNKPMTYNKLKYIKGHVNIYNCFNPNPFVVLEGISGNVTYNHGHGHIDIDLSSVKYIGGDLEYRKLKATNKQLSNLEYIGGSAYFYNLVTATGLEKLTYIGGHADFLNLTDARGLCSLEYIGGCAEFPSLTNSKGLENLKHVGITSNFDKLQNDDRKKILKRIIKW